MKQTLLKKLQWKSQKSPLGLDPPGELPTVLADLSGTPHDREARRTEARGAVRAGFFHDGE